MLRIKVNTSSGKYVDKLDITYIRPGKEGNECRNRCPQSPYYCCTRDRGHRGDCAAHGFVGTRRQLVMFARWNDTTRSGITGTMMEEKP